MSVKIRLSRIGKKNRPFFRIVALDSRKKRDGAVLSNIGTYDPQNTAIIRFQEDLYKEWVSKGAEVSDSAKKIYRLFKKVGTAQKSSEEVKKVAVKAPKKATVETQKEESKVPEITEAVEEKIEKTESKEEETA